MKHESCSNNETIDGWLLKNNMTSKELITFLVNRL